MLQTEANKKQPLPKKISAELDIKRVILLGDTFFIRPGSDPQAIEDWADAPLAKLLLAQRSAVNKQIAQDLRRSQVKRITSQQAPDGQTYTARKKRKNLWGKIGRIKRQEAAMFTKLRKQKSLKILQDANQWQRDSTEAWRVLPGSSGRTQGPGQGKRGRKCVMPPDLYPVLVLKITR
ncbi:phage virion morphogenesis protein [Glaciimonas sp. PAMC28666]|uniref:phage virion morphogenesis protein n=1 Tax=Glaciimonas sp. PAMC28666 TaxID=2807626 RepID=UPI001966AE1D|nr:phage virion morphogenesis protein [Glaciimonas sp. PAMC28666]QRX83280.1 phage virion morphogenesis protein [Glaciimonas sp. PAMC28666]